MPAGSLYVATITCCEAGRQTRGCDRLLVAHQAFERAGLVVDGQPVDDGLAGLVQADDLDLGAVAAELQHDRVERGDAGDVPDMRAADVDDDPLQRLLEVEGGSEVLGRGEEDLALDDVGARPCRRPSSVGGDPEELRDLAGEEDAARAARRRARRWRGRASQTTATTVASMTIAGASAGACAGLRSTTSEKVPIETMIMTATSAAIGICCTQSPSTTIRKSRKTPAQKRREPAAPAGLHVDDRLADHGAAGHAADEAGGDVGEALADAFPVLVARRVGQVVDDRARSSAIPAGRPTASVGRVGQDDPQRLEGERHVAAAGRPAASTGSSPMSPTVRTSSPKRQRERRQHDDADQRRRDRLREAREEVDDARARRRPSRRSASGTPISSGSCAMKIRIASALTKPVITERETKRITSPSRRRPAPIWRRPARIVAASRYCSPCSLHERDHQHRRGGGGGRDHAGPAAGEGDDDGDGEGGVEADLGVDAGDDREGDRLGDERQGDDEAGEKVGADVAEPFGCGRRSGRS